MRGAAGEIYDGDSGLAARARSKQIVQDAMQARGGVAPAAFVAWRHDRGASHDEPQGPVPAVAEHDTRRLAAIAARRILQAVRTRLPIGGAHRRQIAGSEDAGSYAPGPHRPSAGTPVRGWGHRMAARRKAQSNGSRRPAPFRMADARDNRDRECVPLQPEGGRARDGNRCGNEPRK